MNKQSEIIKILSKYISGWGDCPPVLECYDWCTGERCDRIHGNSALCWVRWAAERIKGESK